MEEEYNLEFKDLKSLSDFKGADSTLHRLRNYGLIDYKKERKNRYLYSLKSVTQAKLIPELKKCAFDKDEIRDAFEKVPLDILEEKIKEVSITLDKFFEFLQNNYGVVLDLDWLWKAEF
jgi:DNA-binding transcriptional MerR regulator